MFMKNVKEKYGADNQLLAQILKCSVQRVNKLENLSVEITTNDFCRICNHFNIRNEDMEMFASYSVMDNFFTKKLKEEEKKIGNRQ